MLLKIRKTNTLGWQLVRHLSNTVKSDPKTTTVLFNTTYTKDDFTNVTDKILSHLGKELHNTPNHPLCHIKQRIVKYFHNRFLSARGNPIFSSHDNLPPIVTTSQNFDSLLTPKDHISRSKSDCYYLNREYLLRAHMTAHQVDLIRSGLDNFIIFGDVYRRDEIDKTHYPVFHQVDGVRLKTRELLFRRNEMLNSVQIFEEGNNTEFIGEQEKQRCHTLEAVKVMEYEMKACLEGLATELFGDKIEYRWIDAYFPFTQPSWELEVFHENSWLEILGCGIMQHAILTNSGVANKIGWAFGLGLERIAMCVYKIPDIRLFWSNDSGFLNQFKVNFDEEVTYKAVSQYPQCTNDISFWLPQSKYYSSSDFYDLVRGIGSDMVEQVVLVDEFSHPKTGKTSHCYRIIYRHMERTLTQAEVNQVHKKIAQSAVDTLGVELR